MSWRTQGSYRGLSPEHKEWLRGFDRDWDTKELGRDQADAFCFISGPILVDPTAPEYETEPLDLKLLDIQISLASFTVPRALKRGWSIHMVLRDGRRVRARFPDRSSADQAHQTLREFSFMNPAC